MKGRKELNHGGALLFHREPRLNIDEFRHVHVIIYVLFKDFIC